ncbi:CAP domain-containing protein [Verrucomicrobiales bacterium BCK34]|nr:CAP domain-containing protein [Verrucomicrobiales bacterium BCK34]
MTVGKSNFLPTLLALAFAVLSSIATTEARDRLVTVNFVNQTSHPVDILWLESGRKEVKYASLPPGTAYEQLTYPGHTWHCRCRGEVIHRHKATKKGLQEVLLEDPVKPSALTPVSQEALRLPIVFRAPDFNAISLAVLIETNKQRVHEGLPPLQLSPQLSTAAQMHADDMVSGKFFSHNNPRDAAKATLELRLKMTGFNESRSAENIATAFAIQYVANTPVYPGRSGVFMSAPQGPAIPPHTPETFAIALVKQWMSSPGHRKNILSRNTFMGVGVAFFPDSNFNGMMTAKAVQIFGTE